MSTKTSTAALGSLSQRLLLFQRGIPRHPASGFFGSWKGREILRWEQGYALHDVLRCAQETERERVWVAPRGETVSGALNSKRLIRIKDILERAGFKVEFVDPEAGPEKEVLESIPLGSEILQSSLRSRGKQQQPGDTRVEGQKFSRKLMQQRRKGSKKIPSDGPFAEAGGAD